MLGIIGFWPMMGWPGTILEIKGVGFSTNRDGNVVRIGDVVAIVIEATETFLRVLVGEGTTGGKLSVEANGALAYGDEFKVEPHPDSSDIHASGAPRFFHASVPGTPGTNKTDQKILVLFCYSSGSAVYHKIANEIAKFEMARDWWNKSSYGSTTWSMSYSDWLALPETHERYFWGQSDVDLARDGLLSISRRPLERVGSTLLRASASGVIPIDHPSPLNWSYHPAVIGDGTQTLGLRRRGNYLYATTRGGSLFIYDVSSPNNPQLAGSINIGTFPVYDVDLLDEYAILACGEYGLLSIDVSNVSAPTVASGLPGSTTADWRTVVRVAGRRIYSNGGWNLRISEIGEAGNFKAPGGGMNPIEIRAAGWITGISIEGATCAVATDDGGLQLFELTDEGALLRSNSRVTPRLCAVELVGGYAYAAGYDAGLVIYDCRNVSEPARVGGFTTTLPSYDIRVNGREVIVATGDSVVISIDASDPANPTLNGSQPSSGFEPSLSDQRDKLSTSLNNFNQVRDRGLLMVDAVSAWLDTLESSNPSALDPFEGIVVMTEGPVRATSWVERSGSIHYQNRSIPLNNAKGMYYSLVGERWTIHAHEICHWLDVDDTYQEAYADGSVLLGSAAPWCLSGDDGRASLFLGHWMDDALHWYFNDPDSNTSNVVTLAWDPIAATDKSIEIVAHGHTEEPHDSERCHLVKLVISSGQSYFLEVRQNKPLDSSGQPLPFDQNLPLETEDPGRVVVTRLNHKNSPANTFERDLQLVDVLAEGGVFVDPARNLTVTVEARTADNPLAYRVRVQWNTPVEGDLNGTFDLAITPWNRLTWETPDIWVDSPRNNRGDKSIYEFHVPGQETMPAFNGDRPWVKRPNKIYARIRNTGPQAADEAYVSCYITQPPGIGDNGTWQLIETKRITRIEGYSEQIVDFDWTPAVAGHTCISIAIQPRIGEINTNNNRAQENVAAFDSGSASSHQPIVLEAEVRSPYEIWKKVDLLVFDLPEGWHAVVDQSWVWLGPKAAKPMRAVIWSDLNTPGAERREIPPFAMPRVEGWTDRFDGYQPIGGILAPVRAAKKVEMILRTGAGRGYVSVSGSLVPPILDVGMTLEAMSASGELHYGYGRTDTSGSFLLRIGSVNEAMKQGVYSLRVFTQGGGGAVEAESDLFQLTVD